MTSISPDERYFVLLKRQNELCLYRVPIDEDVPLTQQTSANIYHPFPITSATFPPDSSQIAFGSEDGTVILSSLDTNYEDSVPSTAIVSVCTSPDGQFCAYANKRGAVEICELSTGVVMKTISASVTLRNTDIESMAFSPSNEFLAIHYTKIVTVERSHCLRLGLLFWDMTVSDSQPDMLEGIRPIGRYVREPFWVGK
jgi:WD40 repeat protein